MCIYASLSVPFFLGGGGGGGGASCKMVFLLLLDFLVEFVFLFFACLKVSGNVM